MKSLPDFVEGAIDLDVHRAPDVDVRWFNDLGLGSRSRTPLQVRPKRNLLKLMVVSFAYRLLDS